MPCLAVCSLAAVGHLVYPTLCCVLWGVAGPCHKSSCIVGLYHKPKKPERCTTFAQREKIRAKVRPQFKARRGWDDDTHLDYYDSDACSLYTLELQACAAPMAQTATLWLQHSTWSCTCLLHLCCRVKKGD